MTTPEKDSPRVWRNARLATLKESLPDLGIIENGAIAVQDGRIAFAGPESDLPPDFATAETVDCGGRWITPGLIDCHTHLVHAGNRAHEFELRLAGASYEEVARAGGGIVSSVKALRDYGMALGIAFQLADDALDYGATAEALGKNAGDDFNEGKATLPLLLGAARTKGREAAFWERTITKGERTPEDFGRARELIIGSGAIGATLDLAGDYADVAKAALAPLPSSDWRVALEDLADFAVSRAA